MTIFVPLVMAARLVMWSLLDPRERGGSSVPRELLLLALCTLVGGFNDWNTVVRHGVYDYAVPHFFPAFSTIPLWMLLYWGMILRFLVTLFRWRRLGPPPQPTDHIRLPGGPRTSPVAKVGIELLMVAITRQLIYRFFEHPLLSWLPFVVAVMVFAVLFRLDRHDRILIAIFAIGGPLVEMLYIHVGGLHVYRLGWLGGVPLWIAVWWILAALIWKDLSLRLSCWRRCTGRGSGARSLGR